jgi:hypothetical protein
MAKPRTFVSSTCLDLKDARAGLENHLKSIGHEPLLSDTLTFGVTPRKHSHQVCLDQVDNSDYFILLIGGRRGGTFIGSEKSITNEEYRRAMKRNLPVMIFVSEDVEAASRIYRKNPKADLSDFVDDNRIFDFVDLIRGQSEDNWIRTYKNVEDVKKAITAQFAYICLCYSQDLRKSNDSKPQTQVHIVKALPKDFNVPKQYDQAAQAALISGLKNVHKVINKIQNANVSGKDEKLKVIWVMGRYGTAGRRNYGPLRMNLDRFKQYAFGAHKAQRVFNQLSDFGIEARLAGLDPEEEEEQRVELTIQEESESETKMALQHYIKALLARHDEDDALELFKKADMTVLSQRE